MRLWSPESTRTPPVLGGCEDEELSEHSIRLMETFVRGERVLILRFGRHER